MSDVIDMQERGMAMTKKKALSLYAQGNMWLVEQIAKDAKCECGSCHLCAYRWIEKALSKTPD